MPRRGKQTFDDDLNLNEYPPAGSSSASGNMASAPDLLPMLSAMNQVHTSETQYDLYNTQSFDDSGIDPDLLPNYDLTSADAENQGNFDNIDTMLFTYFIPSTLDDFSLGSQVSGLSSQTSGLSSNTSYSTHHGEQPDQDYQAHSHASSKRIPRTDSRSACPTSSNPSRKKRGSVPSITSSSHFSAAEQRTRNKKAAVRSRQKRGRENDQLITDERALTVKHRALQECISGLEQQIYSLNNMLLEHKDCDCNVIRQYYQRKAERKKEPEGKSK